MPDEGKERPLPKKTVACLLAQQIHIMPHSIHPFLLSLEPTERGRLLTMADRDTQMLDPVVHFCSFYPFHSIPLIIFVSLSLRAPNKTNRRQTTGWVKMSVAEKHKNGLENLGQVSF